MNQLIYGQINRQNYFTVSSIFYEDHIFLESTTFFWKAARTLLVRQKVVVKSTLPT